MYRYKRKENVRILHGMVYKKTWSFLLWVGCMGLRFQGWLGCWVQRLPVICVDISSCIQVSFQLDFPHDFSQGWRGASLKLAFRAVSGLAIAAISIETYIFIPQP
jgi:hypothetical protein